MATSEKTKKEDEKLREELRRADLGKFKKLLKKIVAPKTKKKRTA